ncbi:MAG: AEC family transporter [Eubacteriales bacterium]|nr:AEC family transporter [Eubacteriales bacterium]
MLTVFIKIAVIFSIIAIGYIANKTKILPYESNQYLVKLMLVITTPFMILSSISSKTLTDETLKQTTEVIIGSLIFFFAAAAVSYVIVKCLKYEPKCDRGILMVVITGVNTGFMGFPITKAIFGDEYFFLMVIENIVLTVYLYSIAVFQMNIGNEKKQKLSSIFKPLANMCTFAAIIGIVLLFTGTKLPEPILDLATMMGDATIPISMLVVGIQLGQSDLKKIIKNGKLIFCSLCNVILIPLLTYLVVNPLSITDATKVILVFAAAFPSAVVTVAVASKEGKNAGLMAEGVALTTLFSLFTLPLFAMFLLSRYC